MHLALCIWPLNHSVVPIALRPLSLVFGVELAGLLEDPTASVGMISRFIGVALNLT